jgi:two-component system nitrate/nitrite response regulator NarL
MFYSEAPGDMNDCQRAGKPHAGAKRLGSHRRAMERSVNKIRLLLADDHPVVRKGIGSCLAKYRHLEVVGEAADGRQAVNRTKELSPDIVLLDLGMPALDGVAVTELLQKESPNTKVLVLTVHQNKDALQRLVQAGIRGYLLKDAAPEEIVRAIDAVYAGEIYFSPDVAQLALNQYVATGGGKATSPLDKLTDREREVLALIAEGYSNKEVASKLYLSVRTVETHRERVMRKLEIHSAAGLTKFAITHGLVTLEKPLGAEPAA